MFTIGRQKTRWTRTPCCVIHRARGEGGMECARVTTEKVPKGQAIGDRLEIATEVSCRSQGGVDSQWSTNAPKITEREKKKEMKNKKKRQKKEKKDQKEKE
ncbi:hypothetical protein PoB_000520700 [Plakobranchus ocellatus]|uniref:Uncharacterized protein n=1 Tax=Plakobranchus ocellatus TaxID=259542 RepID=A0AAV3Y895_9GAST|nr:hypothetical protein PoB_000520700 [Plakobranchus ocellatus]